MPSHADEELIFRAYMALDWCVRYKGECLADHKPIVRRFRRLRDDLSRALHREGVPILRGESADAG